MIRLEPLEIELAGTSLIEASAGTGKTFTIATLYLRLLLERELSVGEILVVTYTRAATAELRDRIRRRIAAALSALANDALETDVVLQSLFAGDNPATKEKLDRSGAVRRLSTAWLNLTKPPS